MDKVTIFKNMYDTERPHYVSIETVLKRIQDGSSKSLVDKIRSGDNVKNSLPVVLFSGVFTKRQDDTLRKHSGYIVLDFDKLDDAVDVKGQLSMDPYIHSCWISPSGNGVKALVKIADTTKHREHFKALIQYFDKQYGLELDGSGINESRACFESYDPDIIINDDNETFAKMSLGDDPVESEPSKESTTDYMKLNLAANMIRMAEDGEKHAALLKASKLCGGYIAAGRMEEEEAYRVLLREIQKRDIESVDGAKKTIQDGIEHGKILPISETISSERDIKRQMMIADGDMSFLSSDSDDLDWINDYACGNIKLGLTTGNEDLDAFFLYKKEFVVINGHSNVGKTTTAMYLMVNASIHHGWKWVVYSSENKTAAVKMTLMQFAYDMPVKNMNSDQRKQAYDWVKDHFIVISNKDVYSYSDIIVFIERVRKMHEIDAVFIDPYNSLKITMSDRGIGTHEYHYEAASEMLTYSTANDIAVWLNVHSVTEAQRRKGDDDLPVAPFAEDTEGGGKFVNRADCFLTIHRKVQHPDPYKRKTTELHVRKVRVKETGGEPTPLDGPVEFVMDSSKTAFRVGQSGQKLFSSLSNNFNNYRQFDLLNLGYAQQANNSSD